MHKPGCGLHSLRVKNPSMNILSARTAQYRARKAALTSKLGGRCVLCGNTAFLQFDVIKARTVDHHGLGSLERIRIYELLAEQGRVQLLCPNCHVKKSIAERRGQGLKWNYEI